MTLTELPVADRVDCLCELLSCTGGMYEDLIFSRKTKRFRISFHENANFYL